MQRCERLYWRAMTSVLVLLNPNAGGGRALKLEADIRARIRTDYPTARFVVTSTVSDGLALIGDTAKDARIVVIGGDGTVNRMLPGIVSSNRELAVVPLGSGNDVARALGVFKLSWEEALAHAIKGESSPVDVGRVAFDDRDVPFLACCTIGFDSAVALRALNGPKKLRGLPRYLLATVREIVALRHWQLAVHCDGAALRSGSALFASVLNTPTFGSGMPAVPHASINDGKLDTLIAGRFTRLSTMLMLPKLLLGKHLPDARIHTQPFSDMQIYATPAVPLAVDGEYLGESTTVSVRVLPSAIRVVARST